MVLVLLRNVSTFHIQVIVPPMSDAQLDDPTEKPLDPAVIRVQQRLQRLMLWSRGIMLVGFAALFGVIFYKFYWIRQTPAAATATGTAATPVSASLAMPDGGHVVASRLDGNRLLLTIDGLKGSTVLVLDADTLQVLRRLELKPIRTEAAVAGDLENLQADERLRTALSKSEWGDVMTFSVLSPFTRPSTVSRQRDADPFNSLRREIDRMFEDFSTGWPARTLSATSGFLVPKINVTETDKGLEITADLPGVDQKDIQLDLNDGVLTIKAEHKAEKEENDEKKQYHLVERSYGTFLRRLELPFEADEDKIVANFDKGVLKVTVPKSASPAKQAKKIAINAA
eukprot:gene21756-22715_t